jgi:methylmalonyl-CoA/ethylmalonyl-CoA epimerase
LYYAVDGIDHTYATLRARGVRFVDEPHVIARVPDHDLWMTDFRDSEDNVLELMSEARR